MRAMGMRSHLATPAAVACAIVLAGCGPRSESRVDDQAAEPAVRDSNPAPRPAESSEVVGLSGTQWRLVEFQSMDDAVGTTRPEDPSAYTLAFNADGTVAMRLDCNRGTGPWSATPGETGQTGSLTIGPLGVTRALCPPPSMGEQIARDMDYVRGYMLRDGQLSLSLMADGGIYLWEPDTAPEGPEE